MNRRFLYVVLLALISFSSCMKDEEYWQLRNSMNIGSTSGVYITNEGNFTYNNASLSYYNAEKQEVYNEAFLSVNGHPLGDVAMSCKLHDSLLYVVMNNSGKIIVLDADDFSYKKKITGLTSPRYIHIVNSQKAYVTDLYAHAITVVNPETCEISGYINVHNSASSFNQHPTEQMVALGDRVFVSCWSFDNTVLVIDSKKDEVVDSIKVANQPNSMVADKFDRLWVLSDGGYPGIPGGQDIPELICIEPISLKVLHRVIMDIEDSPTELNINGTGDTLYYLNRDLCRLSVDVSGPPEVLLESPYPQYHTGGFYGLGIDPNSSEIYVADAIDFNQPGVVYRYTADAFPVDTFRVGINPGSFCFK